MDVRLHDLTLHYEDHGQGLPLLLLHAFPLSGAMFQGQAALADAARLLVPDFRGTGQSSLTPGPYTMDLLAQDMVALLDQLRIERAVVLGVSLGGYVAMAMVARFPERVHGLVLANTRAEADSLEASQQRQKTVEGLQAEGPAYLRDRVAGLFGATARRTRPELVAQMQTLAERNSSEGLIQLTFGLAQRLNRQELLPLIQAPTLILAGEEDTLTPPEEMRALAKHIPKVEFRLLLTAGHLAACEQPEAFNAVVRQFLARIQ
jgi:pimeloyl-ACP methyl ester carboxylesterase